MSTGPLWTINGPLVASTASLFPYTWTQPPSSIRLCTADLFYLKGFKCPPSLWDASANMRFTITLSNQDNSFRIVEFALV